MTAAVPAPPSSGAPATGATAEAERVIVTGSNIPTAEEVGPNPVTTLNRDYIQKTGTVSVEQLLKDQPVNNSNSIPISNNGTSQGGPVGFSLGCVARIGSLSQPGPGGRAPCYQSARWHLCRYQYDPARGG